MTIKKVLKILFANSLLLTFLLVGLQTSLLQAQNYNIPKINVDVEIKNNGTVHIEEQRTYEFEGSFSWADYSLPTEGFSEIKNIRVLENEKPFINENSETQGTFKVAKNSNQIAITWFYEAEDENRMFTVAYELEDAVTVGPEWSQFFWNYLAENREKATDSLDITISLPTPASADSLYGWSRGATEHLNFNTTEGTFNISAADISDNEFLKVRTVFPTSVFNRNIVAVTDSDFGLEFAREDEKAYLQQRREQQEQEAANRQIAQAIAALIGALSIFIFYTLYRKYGKRYSTYTLSDRETVSLPDRTSPALIGWLLTNRTTTSQHLLATLLDLSRRGYFRIHEQEAEESFLSDDDPLFTIERTDQEPNSNLAGWELEVLEFAERRINEGNTQLDELFDGSSSEVSKWYKSWTQSVEKECRSQNWIDDLSYSGAYWNAGLQSVLLACSAAAAVLLHPISLIGAGIALILLIMSMGIIRRTRIGEETFKRWSNYKKGLRNADEHTIKMDMLDRHFIYATTFGLSKKEIESLFETGDKNQNFILPWIILMQGNNSTPAAVGSSLTTLAATGSTSFAGTSAGAGASAGAAGGGASGGAG